MQESRLKPARISLVQGIVLGLLTFSGGQLAVPAKASAVTLQIGRTTVATQPVRLLGGYKTAQRVHIAAAGTLTSVSAYLDGKNATTGTAAVRAAVYGENQGPGKPAELLGSSATVVNISAGSAAKWLKFTVNVRVGAGWDVWLTLVATGGNNARTYTGGSGSGVWATNPTTAPTNPFGTANFFNGNQSIYATETTSPTSPVKVMPLGDSITDGYAFPGGYRTELWRKLVQTDQNNIDIVGSLANGPATLGDKDNEGHSGYCIDGLCWGDANATIRPHIAAWLTTAKPDVILLHIGTNDLGTGSTGAATAGRLDTLINTIYTSLPNTKLVVAQLIPMYTNNNSILPAEVTYNDAIPGIVSKYRSQGRNIQIVDMRHVISREAGDYNDGWHPNQQGYNKMAAAWYPVVTSLYKTF